MDATHLDSLNRPSAPLPPSSSSVSSQLSSPPSDVHHPKSPRRCNTNLIIKSSEQATMTNAKIQKQDTRKNMVRASIRDAVAGAAAGAFAKTAVAPIERVKLLMQLSGSLSSTKVTRQSAGSVHGSPGFAKGSGGVNVDSIGKCEPKTQFEGKGAWNVARMVYQEEGLFAFWRGNTPNVIRQGGTAALNFMLMDWYKLAISPIMAYSLTFPSNRTKEERQKHRALLASFLSGGLAGGTTTTVLYPIEFLRTRLAMDVGRTEITRSYPRGMRDVFCTIWGADGIRGLYQGYGIALSGVIVYRALHLGGYDACKTELLHRRRNDLDQKTPVLTMGERFGVAQIVSIVAGTICYPIDSVRRRMMMQAGLRPEDRLYRNSLHAFRRIWVKEGIRGFYLGIGPNLIRSFGGALLLVAYDVFKGMVY